MTKKEMFTAIKATLTDAEQIAFIDHEIELLSRKRTSVNSKAKAEAEARAERVYNALTQKEEPVTISEFLKLTADEEVAGYTNQRVSALFRKLGDKVVKEMRGKKAYFTVA